MGARVLLAIAAGLYVPSANALASTIVSPSAVISLPTLATSVRVCALLHKPARSRIEVKVDYLGFTIEDRFVVGYGLDFAERYRNLPYIGVVERS